MNLNKILDEMQASLTKLRGQIRSKGTAGNKKFVLEKIFHGTSKELSEWLLKQTMHGGEAWATSKGKKPEGTAGE